MKILVAPSPQSGILYSYLLEPTNGEMKMGGYKIIPGHSDYAISKGGKVIRRKDKKMMKPTLSNGYLTVSINGNSTPVHRLVAATYCTNEPLAGKPVHHINGDKLDNRASNLAVCETRQQHDYEHFIIREYFMREVAHTKKFRAYRDMMLNKFEIE